MATELVFRWPLPDTVDTKMRAQLLQESKVEVAIRLFSASWVSSGYAAALLEMSLRDFLDLLSERNIPYDRGAGP